MDQLPHAVAGTGTTRPEWLWLATALVLVALFVLTGIVQRFDTRLLDGSSVWAKPLKFQLSLAIHFATLALVVSWLSPENRAGNLLWWAAVASVAATAFEVGYIMLQAARAQHSHFNVGTPLASALYSAMAIGAVLITVAAAVPGLLILADRSEIAPALRIGTAIGLIGGTILTLVVAFRMGGALDRFVGVEPPGAIRMPLTGWSLSVGDRRVPHFFATHMMQVVPFAGWVLSLALPAIVATVAVLVVAAAYVALTLFLFAQANAGHPILRWG